MTSDYSPVTCLDPIHPGEVLEHDFMEPFGLSATALRLARYFRTDARSWTSLRDRYEL